MSKLSTYLLRGILSLVLIVTLGLFTVGCDNNSPGDEAADNIEEAVDDMGDAAEEAAEDTAEALDDLGDENSDTTN